MESNKRSKKGRKSRPGPADNTQNEQHHPWDEGRSKVNPRIKKELQFCIYFCILPHKLAAAHYAYAAWAHRL